jgi:hypothetical protein
MGELNLIENNETEFGDGDGGGEGQGLDAINMQFVSNGVIVTFMLMDGEEHKEVYNNLSEALMRIGDSVGAYYEE